MPDVRHLFLAGLGRSGTSALADLMVAHPAIAVGMERYKFGGRREGWEMTPRAFERDAFFDFSDELTNITPASNARWKEYYAGLESKWDGVEYVGDKITHLGLGGIWETLPDARFVCIIRNVFDVAASWQVRSDNPQDSWAGDAFDAVERWNRGLRQLARARRARPDQVAVVEYERLYGDPDATSLRAIVSWLGLAWDDQQAAAFDQMHRDYVEKVAPKPRVLSTEAARHIAENAELGRWKRLSGFAL